MIAPTGTTPCAQPARRARPSDVLVGGGATGLGRRRAVAEDGRTAAAAGLDHHHRARDAPVPEDHRPGRRRLRVSLIDQQQRVDVNVRFHDDGRR